MRAHPDVEAEQAYIDRAQDELDRATSEVRSSLAWAEEDRNDPDAAALAANLRARLYRLETAGDHSPCFARLDDEDGERLYIGRQHIADRDQEPIVIDWRAPRASAFYRATPLDPMGCVLRRQFILEGRELVEIYDTDLSDPGASAGVPDPLLAEINRARTGRMRDVVATIQVEQDEIVRAPREQPLFVQGGPGTGKTVVGLHRAAYLLYEHRDVLSADGVMVLGPNERFIAYISDVLPQLGERTVRQQTLTRLLDPDQRLGPSTRPTEVDRLRSDERMVALVEASLRSRAQAPERELRVRTRQGGATVSAEQARALMDEALATAPSIGQARQRWVAGLVRALFRELPSRANTSVSDYATEVRRTDAFGDFVDEHWRTTSPAQAFSLVWRTLAESPEVAVGCGFSPEEVDVLAPHRHAKPVDSVDAMLVDEIRAALGSRVPTYGHVVLDEAQDLTPLELRAVGRRVDRGSITVLGDLAQSTGLHAHASWDDVARLMAVEGHEPAVRQLSIGYRVPAEFVEVANRLLALMTVDLPPTGFIRSAGRPVDSTAVDPHELAEVVDRLATEQLDRSGTVAVIGPPGNLDELGHLHPDVARLTPAEAKGLEFDAVVVVEPAAILDTGPTGPNLLFVALTRALQELHLVGSRPLPEIVAGDVVDAA